MLPAFVLYWAAAADFNFAVGTGAFKESCTAWIFIFCWVLQLVFGFYGGLNQHHPHSGWFALRLEAFLPADAKASPQKLPNCTSFTSSPFLGALYFFIYFSNGSTNSFNTNWSLSLSSCNCSAIYFFIAFSFLPTVST